MEDNFQKIKHLDEIAPIAAELRAQGRKIVHCHGVFDLIHLGHMRHLSSAKALGDVLVVTTTADRHVKRGPGRPIFNEQLRAEALASLAVTDFICVVDSPTAIEAIKAITPHCYVKGPDYKCREDDVTGMIDEEEQTVNDSGGQIVFTEDETFSSSKLLNLYFDSYPPRTLDFLKKFAGKYSVEHITQWMRKAKDLKVLVIGDTIIDQYHYCMAMGKSAKENIVANRSVSIENFAGGILATANHSAQLSSNVTVATALGENESFEDFARAQLDSSVSRFIISRPGKRSIVKRRYVNADDNKKLFEICTIDDELLTDSEERNMLDFLDQNLPSFDLVVVNDFGHGLFTRKIMEKLCANSKCLALNVQTNSANIGFNLVTKYLRADFVCIDEYEMRLATREKHKELRELIKKIASFLDCKQVLVTRGSNGSLSYSEEHGFVETPAFATKSIDKVGAGDAFFAYASQCYALGMPQELTGFIGNAVGALKLQIMGNREPVKIVDVMKFITRMMKV